MGQASREGSTCTSRLEAYSGPTLGVAAIQEVNQKKGDLSSLVSLLPEKTRKLADK